jgi:putative photosynthetic complex assembly protein
MSAHSHADMLPRGTLVIAGALVLFAFTATAIVRIADIPAAASPATLRTTNHIAAVASRNLRFVDRGDGAVVIEDVDKGSNASVIQPGQQTGFIRGVMRGLARERKMRGIGNQPPFNLSLWSDGELSLTDSATGRSIELTAFGSSNRASFLALLPGSGS